MANGNAGPNPLLVILALFVWFLVCWVWPVIKLRDKETSANMKTMWSGWLIIAGMGPIFYGIYTTYMARGNAASSTTGGNNAPEHGSFLVNAPKGTNASLPSSVAGAEAPNAPKVA
jgi:hypothetical protein